MNELFRVEILESSDGGRPVWEAVTTVGDITALYRAGTLKVGNIRPDHEVIGYEPDGVTPRYANSSARIGDWTEALLDGTAILGNLTWNLNPDFTVFKTERDKKNGKLYLILMDGSFDTEIDSASRHRAILRAVRDTRAGDSLLERKISVRIFNVRSRHGGSTEFDSQSELIAEEVFTAYQNWGQSVNQSVTKYNFQKTPVQQMFRLVMDLTPHLGDNVETQKNTVSPNSEKLVAYNTWSMSGENFWRIPLSTRASIDNESKWLAEWWNELVKIRPELEGGLSADRRKENREHLVSATALGFFGFIGLASRMRGEDADFAALEHLSASVRLQRRGFSHEKGTEVDYFDFDNPVWEERGIVSRNGSGTRLITRNNYQSRREVASVILDLCGFKG